MPKDAEGVYEPGQTLTEEEKGEILKDVARQKAEQKAVADKVKNAKTSVALGITRKAPAAGSTSKSAAASKPAGIEGMLTAAKKPVLSPEEQAAAEAAEAEAAAAAAAEAQARRLEAAAAADAERERRWAESEAQRQEIQNQIVEEERRVRKREEERCKRLQPSPSPSPALAPTLTLALASTFILTPPSSSPSP